MPILRISRAVLFSVIVATTPVYAHAQSSVPNSTMSPQQAEQSPAGKFVQDLGDKGIKIVRDKSIPPDQRATQYAQLLHDAFDIPAIGHFVLGRTWGNITADQQQEYLKLFEDMTIKMYGDKLGMYSGESFTVKTVRAENDKDIIVVSDINHPEGTPPTSIEWRVRQNNGGFKVVDVTIEGVSQSVTERQEFASVLQRNNGNIDILLQMMRDRAQAPAQSPPGT